MSRSEQVRLGPGATATATGTRRPADWARDAIADAAVAASRRRCGSALAAVILTGSWAREEATLAPAAEGWRVLGDAEFVLVCSPRHALPGAAAQRAVQAETEAELATQGLACAVSVSAVHPRYLRRMQPHIYGYELRACGDVLWGDRDALALIPPFAAAAIPCEDAWHLLCNRMIEQIEIAAHLPPENDYQHRPLPAALAYAAVKLYLDIATSYLVFRGAFAPGYGARRDILRALSHCPDENEPPFDLGAVSRCVDTCTDWKLGAETLPNNLSFAFWQAAAGAALQLWNWELRTMVGEPGGDWARFARQQPLRARLRGWAALARQAGWPSTLRHGRRWSRLARRASPRLSLYRAAAILYGQLPALLLGGELDVRDRHIVADLLPAPMRAAPGWRTLARALAWNFHAFTEKTRS